MEISKIIPSIDSCYENWEILVKISSEPTVPVGLGQQPWRISIQNTAQRNKRWKYNEEAGHKPGQLRSCNICLVGVSDGEKYKNRGESNLKNNR